MENETHISGKVIAHEQDPILLEHELKSFQSVAFSQPITAERLAHWSKGSVIRREILATSIWGTIQWRKSIGRPLAPTLASAFVIEHVSWQSKLEYTQDGGFKFIDLVVPHSEPWKWDGPEDENYYRVSFMTETTQRPNRIRVNFAANIGWEHQIETIGRGYRDIEPSERQFLKGEEPYVIEPFEVVRRLIHRTT